MSGWPWLAGSLVVVTGALVGWRPDGPPPPRRPAPAWVVIALRRAAVDHDPAVVLRAWVGAWLAAGLAGGFVAGPVGAVGALVLGALGSLAGLRAADHRHHERLERALPGLLEAVAAELRSGVSLQQALTAASRQPGPLAAELRAVVDRVERGRALGPELERWAGADAPAGLRLAVAALVLGAEAGGAQGRAVDGVAATLRERLGLRREVAALSSQARASALVMTLTPVAFAALVSVGDRRSADVLLRTPAGLGCLALGLALDAVAGWWMLRLTRAA